MNYRFTKKRFVRTSLLLLAAVMSGVLSYTPGSASVQAADNRNFRAGNIISDAAMSNKNSMSVQQIQVFLNSKNKCNNTNIGLAARYPQFNYSIKNGKFVCMAQESFNGQSAAQIIWQVSQDYSINPQVLIILLEKEQGLISDTWPNSRQYQIATGFGCPDNAPCDAQYYGINNQLRKAANLFRTVLNGGWSNYPVGHTYVQYHPNAACGGSVINIENRATSALYRYTPYQPNQSALNAGYGSGDGCGAYGNRNFWALFTDWFGSTQKDIFTRMDAPRKLVAKNNINKINPTTGATISNQTINNGQVVRYSSKTQTASSNRLCLRTESNTIAGEMMCVLYDNLQEGPSFTALQGSIKLIANNDISKIDPIDNSSLPGQVVKKGQVVEYSSQANTRIGNKPCFRTKVNTASGLIACIPRDKLSNVPNFTGLSNSRFVVAKDTVNKIDPFMETPFGSQVIYKGMAVEFNSQISTFISNKECLRTKSNTQSNLSMCVLSSNFKNYIDPEFVNMDVTRSLITNRSTAKIDPITGESIESLPAGLRIIFSQKTRNNNRLCLRTKTDKTLNKQACVLYDHLTEL